MRLDELPRSDNVEDRRGDGSGGFPMGRTGGIGIGTIILLGLIGWALGINPLYLIGGAEILSGLGGSQQQSQPAPGNAKTEAPPDQMGEFVSAVLGSTEVQWKEIFAQAGKTYEAPTLVMFSGATRSACGLAQSAMGPFYCPNDQKVYLDTAFFQDLERRFRGCDVGSKSCQFSQAYVITHEVGHHVQNLLGILPRVQQAQRGMDTVESNQLQVRVELQADCLAGCGRTTQRKSGGSSSLAMSRRPCRRHPPSATIGCSGGVKAMWCPMLSPMARQNNARAGS